MTTLWLALKIALALFLFLSAGYAVWSVGCGRPLIGVVDHVAVFKGRLLQRRRDQKIRRQWPEALFLMAGSLKSGLTINQAVEILMTEAPQPLRSHLQTIVDAEIDWLPLRVRLERVFHQPDLTLAKAGLMLASESGGKAAQLLETAARVMLKKRDLQDKVEVWTAQGKLSAWIVGLSPFGLITVCHFLSPEFMQPLFATSAGHKILLFVTMMVVCGLVMVHRVVRVE